MLTSVYLARLIGPVLLAAGLGLVLNRALYDDLVGAYLANRAWTYLAGLAGMTAGLAIVLVHQVVAPDWRLLITLLGWLLLVAGALRLVLPDRMRTFERRLARHPAVRRASGFVALAIGAILTIAGYWPQILAL